MGPEPRPLEINPPAITGRFSFLHSSGKADAWDLLFFFYMSAFLKCVKLHLHVILSLPSILNIYNTEFSAQCERFEQSLCADGSNLLSGESSVQEKL